MRVFCLLLFQLSNCAFAQNRDNTLPILSRLAKQGAGYIGKTISSSEVGGQLSQKNGEAVVIEKEPVKEPSAKNYSFYGLDLEAATVIVNMAYQQQDSLNAPVQVNPTTAWVLDPDGILVTNYHVLKEYSSKSVYRSLSIMTRDGSSFPVVEVLSCSPENDLAIFRIDTKGSKLSVLAPGADALPGDSAFVMGHPKQQFYIQTKGIVQGYEQDSLFGKPCLLMNISADFTVGSSGGPVVDRFGNVVGVVSRLRNKNGQMVKSCIPVSELRKLIMK